MPGVTLRTVLRWLPAGSEVDFLKSDIQGMDLQALRSAGDQLGRLRRVQMEVRSPRAPRAPLQLPRSSHL